MPRILRTGSRGFTLLEVIVAMSIAGLVMTCIYAVFSGVTSSAKRVEAQSDRMQTVRFIVTRLEDDLRNAPPVPDNVQSLSQASDGPLIVRTLDVKGRAGLATYTFKDKKLIRTWVLDEVVPQVGAPAPDADAKNKDGKPPEMELATGLSEWTWKPQHGESAPEGFPNAIKVTFRWPAPDGKPGLPFQRLVRLEAEPVPAEKKQ